MKNNLQQSTLDSQPSSSVPSGYKQTEVGVIPEDWEVRSIGQIAPLQRGFDLPNRLLRYGSVPVVYSNGIENYHDQAMAKGPGVVTGRSGTLGKVHYVSSEYWPHNTALWVTNFKDNHPKFIYYLYVATHFDRFASGSGVPTLNRNDAHSFKLAIPLDVQEQELIATALSDMDALLEGLDRLIAKKRNLKQATMQALLTPPAERVESGELKVESDGSANSQLSTLNSPLKNVRLPGFEGEWEVKRLGDVADIRSGGTPSTSNPNFWDGGVPWCTPTDITALRWRKQLRDTVKTISVSGLRASSAETIPIHSVIMTSRATIGECAINIVPMTTNQGFKNLIPRDINFEFLYYLMTTQKERLIQLCGGSTFLEIGKRQLSQLEVSIPPTKKEQAAIAAVLSDMDAEIKALEQRRDKTADLKQAMMQELLTGRIRLVSGKLKIESGE